MQNQFFFNNFKDGILLPQEILGGTGTRPKAGGAHEFNSFLSLLVAVQHIGSSVCTSAFHLIHVVIHVVRLSVRSLTLCSSRCSFPCFSPTFFYVNLERNLFLHVVVIGAIYHWHSAH